SSSSWSPEWQPWPKIGQTSTRARNTHRHATPRACEGRFVSRVVISSDSRRGTTASCRCPAARPRPARCGPAPPARPPSPCHRRPHAGGAVAVAGGAVEAVARLGHREHAGEVAARREADGADAVGVDAVLAGVGAEPADGGLAILDAGGEAVFRGEPVIRGGG